MVSLLNKLSGDDQLVQFRKNNYFFRSNRGIQELAPLKHESFYDVNKVLAIYEG